MEGVSYPLLQLALGLRRTCNKRVVNKGIYREILNLPQSTETESPFLSSNTVIRFRHIITVHKVLRKESINFKICRHIPCNKGAMYIGSEATLIRCLQDLVEGAHKPGVGLRMNVVSVAS